MKDENQARRLSLGVGPLEAGGSSTAVESVPRRLGLTREGLYKKMKRLGIE